MTHPLSIIFMGTPDFAVPTLQALHLSSFDLKYVITQPDRPKGRGRRLTPPPVKKAAIEMGYDVLQPKNIRDDTFVEQLKQSAPDFLVVIAFGQILPVTVLSLPRFGPINVHASLLPKYRGLHTHSRAIEAGDGEHGATVHFVTPDLDSGPIVIQAKVAVEPDDTPDILAARVLEQEHIIYPQAIRWFAEGRLELRDGVVYRDGEITPFAQEETD